MYNIKKNGDSEAVSGVDKFLQFIRLTVARRHREDIRNLVAKRGIVSVLHDRHELDGIIAETRNAWEHVSSKFLVETYTWFRGRDANCGFTLRTRQRATDLINKKRGSI